MRVKEFMKSNPITLNLNEKIEKLIEIFYKYEIGSVIIIDDKKEPFHIITLRDLAKLFFLQPSPKNIREALQGLNKDKTSLISIFYDLGFTEALNLMKNYNISHLPVVNKKNKLVGILSLRDIVKTFPEIIYIDPLTGINNRAYLEFLKTKLKRIKNNVSILMLDLDNFKTLNDKYGHLVGDEVLKKVAQTIRKNVKTPDEVIRYGGEEFLIIAYRCPLKEGFKLGERLRKKIKNIKIKDYKDLKITVSIGVSEYNSQKDLLSVIEEADKAMYSAKKSGKNAVRIFASSF